MDADSKGENAPDPRLVETSRYRAVYVLPESDGFGSASSGADLIDVWQVVWIGKWWILSAVSIAALASIVYALSLTHWYRAEVVLAPAEEAGIAQGLAAQFGGLANLAGVNPGRANAEALAVLRSRDFARSFIEEQNLLPVLYADLWDPEQGTWLSDQGHTAPDMREAVSFFDESIRHVEENRSTGMVVLSVEWTDPDIAAQWANDLADTLNSRMRRRALDDAEANVAYLQSEMSSTSVVALQQSIGRLLESELHKVMAARGSSEYAFRVIDRADVPLIPSRPKRTLIVMGATGLAGVLATLALFIRHFFLAARARRRAVPHPHGTA